MSPDNKIIDLPVKYGRAGGRHRRTGPAMIIIFPGVRIDRAGRPGGEDSGPARRRPPLNSAHAMDEDER